MALGRRCGNEAELRSDAPSGEKPVERVRSSDRASRSSARGPPWLWSKHLTGLGGQVGLTFEGAGESKCRGLPLKIFGPRVGQQAWLEGFSLVGIEAPGRAEGHRMSGMMLCQVFGPTGRWGFRCEDIEALLALVTVAVKREDLHRRPEGVPLGRDRRAVGFFWVPYFPFWVFWANGTRPRCCSWPRFILGGERGSGDRGCQLGLLRCALRMGLCGHLM